MNFLISRTPARGGLDRQETVLDGAIGERSSEVVGRGVLHFFLGNDLSGNDYPEHSLLQV